MVRTVFLLCFSTVGAMMSRPVHQHEQPDASSRHVKIDYRGPSDLREDEVASIIRGWTYWGSGSDAPFLDFVSEDSCNLVLGDLQIQDVTPKGGYDFWCGRENYERLASRWTKDSEAKTGQEVGDLSPPEVLVMGNMIVFEENWEGGPDVNAGAPVAETVVMTLNAERKVSNVIYGLDALHVAGNAAAEAAGDVHPAGNDVNIEVLGQSLLNTEEVKKIIRGWTYWGSGDSQPFLDFVSDNVCNVVLGPLKIGGVDFYNDVSSWCGRARYEALANSWVAASEKAGSDLGDVTPPPVKVIGNMVIFEEDWKGGPLINDGQPVREAVVMVVDPATHLVTNVIYGVDHSSISR